MGQKNSKIGQQADGEGSEQEDQDQQQQQPANLYPGAEQQFIRYTLRDGNEEFAIKIGDLLNTTTPQPDDSGNDGDKNDGDDENALEEEFTRILDSIRFVDEGVREGLIPDLDANMKRAFVTLHNQHVRQNAIEREPEEQKQQQQQLMELDDNGDARQKHASNDSRPGDESDNDISNSGGRNDSFNVTSHVREWLEGLDDDKLQSDQVRQLRKYLENCRDTNERKVFADENGVERLFDLLAKYEYESRVKKDFSVVIELMKFIRVLPDLYGMNQAIRMIVSVRNSASILFMCFHPVHPEVTLRCVQCLRYYMHTQEGIQLLFTALENYQLTYKWMNRFQHIVCAIRYSTNIVLVLMLMQFLYDVVQSEGMTKYQQQLILDELNELQFTQVLQMIRTRVENNEFEPTDCTFDGVKERIKLFSNDEKMNPVRLRVNFDNEKQTSEERHKSQKMDRRLAATNYDNMDASQVAEEQSLNDWMYKSTIETAPEDDNIVNFPVIFGDQDHTISVYYVPNDTEKENFSAYPQVLHSFCDFILYVINDLNQQFKRSIKKSARLESYSVAGLMNVFRSTLLWANDDASIELARKLACVPQSGKGKDVIRRMNALLRVERVAVQCGEDVKDQEEEFETVLQDYGALAAKDSPLKVAKVKAESEHPSDNAQDEYGQRIEQLLKALAEQDAVLQSANQRIKELNEQMKKKDEEINNMYEEQLQQSAVMGMQLSRIEVVPEFDTMRSVLQHDGVPQRQRSDNPYLYQNLRDQEQKHAPLSNQPSLMAPPLTMQNTASGNLPPPQIGGLPTGLPVDLAPPPPLPGAAVNASPILQGLPPPPPLPGASFSAQPIQQLAPPPPLVGASASSPPALLAPPPPLPGLAVDASPVQQLAPPPPLPGAAVNASPLNFVPQTSTLPPPPPTGIIPPPLTPQISRQMSITSPPGQQAGQLLVSRVVPEIKPNRIMKRLNWQHFGANNARGTLWERKDAPTGDSLQINYAEVEGLFNAEDEAQSVRQSNASPQKTDGDNASGNANSNSKSAASSSGEGRIVKATIPIEIAFNQFEKEWEKVLDAFLKCDLEVVSDVRIEQLNQLVGPIKDYALRLSAVKDIATLPHSIDAFFWRMLRVNGYEKRIKLFNFMHMWMRGAEVRQSGRFEEQFNQAVRLRDTFLDVVRNESVKRVLQACLRIGNFVNGGTPRAGALGFQLKSLEAFANIKAVVAPGAQNAAKKKPLSLLQYAIRQCIVAERKNVTRDGEGEIGARHSEKYPIIERAKLETYDLAKRFTVLSVVDARKQLLEEYENMAQCVTCQTADPNDNIQKFVTEHEPAVHERVQEYKRVADECEQAYREFRQFFAIPDEFGSGQSNRAFDLLYVLLGEIVLQEEETFQENSPVDGSSSTSGGAGGSSQLQAISQPNFQELLRESTAYRRQQMISGFKSSGTRQRKQKDDTDSDKDDD